MSRRACCVVKPTLCVHNGISLHSGGATNLSGLQPTPGSRCHPPPPLLTPTPLQSARLGVDQHAVG